ARPRRPPAARAGGGLRLHLLHAVLPLARREAAGVPRGAALADALVLDPDAARRQPHLVGHARHLRGGHAHRACEPPGAPPPSNALRHTENWATVLAACPRHAHWADAEPLTDVLAMGGVVDRYRRMVVDGEPVATGVVSLGRAWAGTKPSRGRGIAPAQSP